MATRIDRLTPAQKARMDEWADKWIEVGLRTGPADRDRFETAVADCYRFAGLEPPRVVVWTSSPLVVALAGPIAAHILSEAVRDARRAPRATASLAAVGGAVRDAVVGAVGGAVDDEVDEAVVGAVRGAVHQAVGDAVVGAVGGAVDDEVHETVGEAVVGAVGEAVVGAVGDAVRGAVDDEVHETVGDEVDEAVVGAVRGAVRDAVVGAVRGAVDEAVDEAVAEAVVGAVDEAVVGAVGDAVRGAVVGAVGEAVVGAVDEAVDEAVRTNWHRVMGGQFWVGGWYWGGAWTSFFRDVCELELPGDLWDRARAYEATMESACWWWPHRDFVIVSERPTAIHRELVDPARPRGWGSHRLHCADGPAVEFQDGWGVWAWHGVRVPRHVIEQPDSLTADVILAEQNAEVRRAMLEIVGFERVLDRADIVDSGSWTNMEGVVEEASLFRLELEDDEPLMVVRVTCPSTGRVYLLRVDPDAYGGLSGEGSARAAVASTWRNPDGSMVFTRPDEYVLAAAS